MKASPIDHITAARQADPTLRLMPLADIAALAQALAGMAADPAGAVRIAADAQAREAAELAAQTAAAERVRNDREAADLEVRRRQAQLRKDRDQRERDAIRRAYHDANID
jgi:hypothetical protein